MQGLRAPNLQQLEQYNVNVDGQPEVLWYPIFDFQVYPIAGFNSLNFFAVPEGAGKSFDDTNMELGGALPVPINMAITNVQVWFFPAANPARAPATATLGSNWNDVNAVMKAGHLQMEIGSKEYLLDAPLMKFPPQSRLSGAAALSAATTVAATTVDNQIDYATSAGQIYTIVPLRLIAQQNFVVRLRFGNGPVALPSGVAGRIGVQLGGFRYRLAQ